MSKETWSTVFKGIVTVLVAVALGMHLARLAVYGPEWVRDIGAVVSLVLIGWVMRKLLKAKR